MATLLSPADQAALGRVLQLIDAEAVMASGYLGGFLEGLSEHIGVMIGDSAPVPSV